MVHLGAGARHTPKPPVVSLRASDLCTGTGIVSCTLPVVMWHSKDLSSDAMVASTPRLGTSL